MPEHVNHESQFFLFGVIALIVESGNGAHVGGTELLGDTFKDQDIALMTGFYPHGRLDTVQNECYLVITKTRLIKNLHPTD